MLKIFQNVESVKVNPNRTQQVSVLRLSITVSSLGLAILTAMVQGETGLKMQLKKSSECLTLTMKVLSHATRQVDKGRINEERSQ